MNDSSEAFTHHVINRMDTEVRSSLTAIQLTEIKAAISANAPFKKHPIDVRGIFPLFFARFYFVVLIGRDKRIKIKRSELIRRRESDLVMDVLFYLIMLSPILLLIMTVLYLSKTELGIDIFPDSHLIDWFQ